MRLPPANIRRFLAVLLLAPILPGCGDSPQAPSAAQEALQKLQDQYDELVQDKLDDPVQWATDDLENIGDWEYAVEEIAYASAEQMAARLNELGNDKWDVIWLEKSGNGFLVIMKRPSISYLSRIPLSQFGRIVTGESDGQE